jgi:isoquinoline 1-oxidoreductase beta subunit
VCPAEEASTHQRWTTETAIDEDGRVEQRNFDGFTPPYITDAPVTVDVHIVSTTEPPTGVGEPPVPSISPAVVNALARLTGKRYRALPLAAL